MELHSPFSFSQLLEHWVNQYCELCGRGSIFCVYGKPSPTTQANKVNANRFQQLVNCWNGMFCKDCGRGGVLCIDATTPNDLPPHTQQPSSVVLVGQPANRVIYAILRDWILSGCAACSRQKQDSLTLNAPIPLPLIMKAWQGTHCHVCGLGDPKFAPMTVPVKKAHTIVHSFKHTIQPRYQPHKRPTLRAKPLHVQFDTATNRNTTHHATAIHTNKNGLVARFLSRQKKH